MDEYERTVREALLARAETAEAEVERLREAGTQAIMDALSWMEPATAKRFTQEQSYERFAAMLAMSEERA